jgi:hypothetical protein
MILILSDMPEGTIGFEAVDEVTTDDYTDVIAPALERRLPDQPLKVLMLLDQRFRSYSPGAALADVRLWLTRLGDWEKLAVVTDHDAITATVNDLGWMGSGTIRTFPPVGIAEAKQWLVQPDV